MVDLSIKPKVKTTQGEGCFEIKCMINKISKNSENTHPIIIHFQQKDKSSQMLITLHPFVCKCALYLKYYDVRFVTGTQSDACNVTCVNLSFNLSSRPIWNLQTTYKPQTTNHVTKSVVNYTTLKQRRSIFVKIMKHSLICLYFIFLKKTTLYDIKHHNVQTALQLY